MIHTWIERRVCTQTHTHSRSEESNYRVVEVQQRRCREQSAASGAAHRSSKKNWELVTIFSSIDITGDLEQWWCTGKHLVGRSLRRRQNESQRMMLCWCWGQNSRPNSCQASPLILGSNTQNPLLTFYFLLQQNITKLPTLALHLQHPGSASRRAGPAGLFHQPWLEVKYFLDSKIIAWLYSGTFEPAEEKVFQEKVKIVRKWERSIDHPSVPCPQVRFMGGGERWLSSQTH